MMSSIIILGMVTAMLVAALAPQFFGRRAYQAFGDQVRKNKTMAELFRGVELAALFTLFMALFCRSVDFIVACSFRGGRSTQLILMLVALIFYAGSALVAWRFGAYPTYRRYAKQRRAQAQAAVDRYRAALEAYREQMYCNRSMLSADDLLEALLAEAGTIVKVPCDRRRVLRDSLPSQKVLGMANLATGDFYGHAGDVIDMKRPEDFRAAQTALRVRRYEQEQRTEPCKLELGAAELSSTTGLPEAAAK